MLVSSHFTYKLTFLADIKYPESFFTRIRQKNNKKMERKMYLIYFLYLNLQQSTTSMIY